MTDEELREVRAETVAWQPIETAPFNEDVLVFSPDSTDPVMICHRCLFGDETEADWDGDWHEQNADMCPDPLDVDVTHWMPLPEPPRALLNKEGEAP